MKSIATLATLLLISACATGPTPTAVRGTTDTVIIPNLNTEAKAEIGQTMISKAYVTTRPGIRLAQDVTDTPNSPGTDTIKAGTLALFAADQTGQYFLDKQGTYTLLGSSVECGQCGIFVPYDKIKSPVVFHFALGYKFGTKPVTGISDTTIETWGKDNFVRELVYSGVSQGTVNVLYREFVDNRARPAFSQDLKYDLNQGTEIGYRGARFQIIKATNTEIHYRVLKPLD